MISTLVQVSAPIKAVFDALVAILDADPSLTNANAYATRDASGGENVGITVTDEFGSSATYSQHINVGRVVVDPPSASAGPGESVQFTATTTDSSGNQVPATVTWKVQSGGAGTVDATGKYTAPAEVTSARNEYVTATSATGSSATASVVLHP